MMSPWNRIRAQAAARWDFERWQLRDELHRAMFNQDVALAAKAEAIAIARSLLAALDRTPGHMPFEDVVAVSNARDRLRELAR